jgi:hypothetical protein
MCKPKACRLTSAETYIICKDFILPIKFDNILLNPGYIFGKFFFKKKNFPPNKFGIGLEKKNYSIFLKIIRLKSKNLYRIDLINLNDEYFVSCGLINFGSFFKNGISKGKKLFQNFYFFLYINWYKIFFLRKKSYNNFQKC